MSAAQASEGTAPAGPTGELPTVTAAILAFNRREELAVTLAKLRDELAYPRDRFEVIVVDNASGDGTSEMVRERFPEVELVVSERNVGVSGWNLAFERARGDYVLVLDDDCYVEGDALERAVRRALESDADLVSFYVRSPGESRDYSAEFETGLLSFWGCSALISRRALEQLGGFDPGIFIWAHEVEFTMRLLDAGLTHLHLPEVSSLHNKVMAPGTVRGFRMNLRHHSYIAAKLMRPRDAAIALANIAGEVLGQGLYHRELLVGLQDVAEGAAAGLRHRRPVRPEVSSLYRRNFIRFAGPRLWFRGPLTRWRGRGNAEAPGDHAQRRIAGYLEARRDLYPTGAGALRV